MPAFSVVLKLILHCAAVGDIRDQDLESRQAMRSEEDNKSGKWTTTGRTASAKIREGLGFRRSISGQPS